MGSCVCLRQHCYYSGVGGAFQRRGLSTLFRKGVVAPGLTAPFYQYHRNRRRVEACVSTGFKEQELRSPDLVALEYADLNLTHNVSQELGHVRIRQHVNPLSSSLSVPVEVPDWNQVFRDPTLPLMVDIGSGSGRFLMWLAKRNLVVRNYLGLEIRQKLVKRADVWVKELGLSNIHFMYANATTSFNQLVSTYPGPLMLVSILCPDPYFKRKHHKRRVIQKPLVDSIVNNLAPRGQVFIQSDVLDVALEMRNQFDSLPHVLKHIDEIESSVLCDSEGWLLSNPMGKRTEREIHAEFEGAKIYRRVYQKQVQKALG
ncbi:tRNA (guanine-N(7)-)-methyltransferase [Rosa sericea]